MQSILNASLFVSLSGIMSLFAGFLSSVVIARFLGAEGTGLTAMALWVAMTGSIVASIGIPAVVLRYISRQEETAEARNGLVNLLYGKFIWPVLIMCGLFAGYGVYVYFTDGLNSAAVWVIAGLICLAYAQGHYVIAADHGLGDFYKTAQKTAFGCALQIPITIAGAFFFGPAGAMLGYLSRYVPQAFGLKAYQRPSRTEDIEITSQMIRYGQSNWLSNLLDTLVKTRIEFLFIGLFFSVTEVGYFAVAATFSSLIVQLSLYLAAGLTPGFGKLFDGNASEKLKISYDRSLRWLTIMLLPVSLGGAVIMPEVIPLAFGEDFLPAVSIAVALVLFALPQALYSVPLSAMLAFEKDRNVLYINAVAASGLVVLNLIFTPMFGGLGAAVIRGLVGFGVFAWLVVHCHKKLGLNIRFGLQLRIIFSGICCAIAAYSVLSLVSGFLGLIVTISVGAIVYLVSLRLTGSIPEEEVDIVHGAFEKYIPSSLKPFLKPAISFLGAGSKS